MIECKLEKTLEFFMDCAMSPVILMQWIKNKTIRWILAIPLLFLSMITLAILGMPILLLIIAVLTKQIVNNE